MTEKSAVSKNVHALLPVFVPTQVVTDFEEAATAAARAVFGSNVPASRCWLHHSQAVIKSVRKTGRTDAYKEDEELQAVVRCLRSLPLLPAGDIPQGFADIKTILGDDSPSKTALESGTIDSLQRAALIN